MCVIDSMGSRNVGENNFSRGWHWPLHPPLVLHMLVNQNPVFSFICSHSSARLCRSGFHTTHGIRGPSFCLKTESYIFLGLNIPFWGPQRLWVGFAGLRNPLEKPNQTQVWKVQVGQGCADFQIHRCWICRKCWPACIVIHVEFLCCITWIFFISHISWSVKQPLHMLGRVLH